MNYLHPQYTMKGFTLIEFMVTMSFLVVFASLSVTGYATLRERIQFQNGASEVKDALQLAQNKAMSAEAGENAGVCFDVNKKNYSIVRGNNCANILATFVLPGNLYFSELPPDNKIIFHKLTGGSSQNSEFAMGVYASETNLQFKLTTNGVLYAR